MGAGKKAPAFAKAGGRIRRPSAGYALPFGHAYRRGGYRLTPSGLRAPAHRERQAKPRALSGRGACLCFGLRVSAKAVLQLGVGFLIYRISRLAKRIDGGIVGAQASGDARALRRPVGFVILLTLRVLTHQVRVIADASRPGWRARRPSPGHVRCWGWGRRWPPAPGRETTDRRPQPPRTG